MFPPEEVGVGKIVEYPAIRADVDWRLGSFEN